MIRTPVEISLIALFVFKLSTDIKFQLMTSFCLQIARMMYWNIAVSKLRKVTVVGDI